MKTEEVFEATLTRHMGGMDIDPDRLGVSTEKKKKKANRENQGKPGKEKAHRLE